MNIAFYTDKECCPTIGGTERTTTLVADSLKEIYGYNVFSIFTLKVNNNAPRYKFSKSLRFSYNKDVDYRLANFLSENEISVVINQGNFYFCDVLHRVIKNYKLKCRQIFALHFMPGSGEEALISFKETAKLMRNNIVSKELLKVLFYPIYYRFATRRFRNKYLEVENKADRIVLLSDSFKQIWIDYATKHKGAKKKPEFDVIPNRLTFDHFADEEEIKKKEKRILIVSRFDERQKKLSKALKIWQSIADKDGMEGWCLDIVGDGADGELYKNIVKENKIPKVTFYGRQNPAEYYERSAIFMMTSDFEGFGMTLIEASQFGVVPIAFDTVPAFADIISNNENGFIIPANDYQAYEKKLVDLATNDNVRNEIAKKAVTNSKRYSPEKIATMWNTLIHESDDRTT